MKEKQVSNSSVAEQMAVNHRVAGSNPAWGVEWIRLKKRLKRNICFDLLLVLVFLVLVFLVFLVFFFFKKKKKK